MTKISVVVPIYNVEKYLDKCIESILGQTFSDFELILVDDGSPDRCPQMCDDWAEKDERIRVIHKENGGVVDARNRGIAQAIGEYTAFVDSDDWVEPEFLQTLYCEITKQNADMVQCAYQRVSPGEVRTFSGEPITLDREKIETLLLPEIAADKLKLLNNSLCNKLYRTELLKKTIYLLDKRILMGEDFLQNFAVAGYCRKIVVLDTKPLYNYRFNEGSATSCYRVQYKFETRLRYDNLRRIGATHGCGPNNVDELRSRRLILYIYECAICTWNHQQKKQEIRELISMIDRKYWLRAIGSYEGFAQRVCAALTYLGWIDLTLWLVDVMKKIKGIE